ncbi:MucB/RseB C-terminal domain-containing protein [Paludibacterium yongneupense]|uniref:MucB/RseB C-terminal domain-containing protein n=1 Tax=Paludibacterium yongneupense TaxID=400061 RepID=UPI0003FAB9C4|nr:MucB/RseB C-terminal domain-containing protein [Paludibacterium yongneupense]
MQRVLSVLVWAGLPLTVLAATPANGDDWALLRRVKLAGQQQALSGTYLHQMSGVVESFRIARAGSGDNLVERRESLDGLPREVVRNGDALTSYAPDKHALMAAKVSAMRLFPALSIEDVADLAQSYTLRHLGNDRVAQRDCNWLELHPRDKLRYSVRLCVDPMTAMPLKMVTLGPRNDVVEQFSFAELDLAAPRDKNLLRPHYKMSVQLRGPGPVASPKTPLAPHVEVTGLPAGFHMIRIAWRGLAGANEQPVPQMVFTDGLAMLSLFVEPVPEEGRGERSLNLHGAINLATGIQGNQLLTLVGDMPEQTLSGLVKTLRVVRRP